jgi:glycosyltransferase involved in cell wall biosynthesis
LENGVMGHMDILCVSHLRWDFVFQRPQHLLTRAACQGRVYYVEEPRFEEGPSRLTVLVRDGGVRVVVPVLDVKSSVQDQQRCLRMQLARLVRDEAVADYVLWYYTPMALPFTADLAPTAVVYDCMDELSAFAGASAQLRELERALFEKADLVFTGGHSLYEAKRSYHENVYLFPSSVDVEHFAQARAAEDDAEPEDQVTIGHPRIGFFGVIDERMDYELLAAVAHARPAWQLILIGPTAKVSASLLPRAANIHYLGPKPYAALPMYIAGWDVAMLPFARNEATRFISPTKTPEYLAAGKPVVSTSIRDVVRPYGQQGLARIADTADEYISAVDASLAEHPAERLRAADAFLTHTSWDGTWTRMRQLIENVHASRADRQGPRAVSAS